MKKLCSRMSGNQGMPYCNLVRGEHRENVKKGMSVFTTEIFFR